ETAVLPEGQVIPSVEKKGMLDTLNEFVDVQEMVEKVVSAAQNLVDIINRLKDPEGPLFSTSTNSFKVSSIPFFSIEGITCPSGKTAVSGVPGFIEI
ncbi:MAG: hypothetical protein V3S89_13585, partial [Desulfobacterales bacterium]